MSANQRSIRSVDPSLRVRVLTNTPPCFPGPMIQAPAIASTRFVTQSPPYHAPGLASMSKSRISASSYSTGRPSSLEAKEVALELELLAPLEGVEVVSLELRNRLVDLV